MVPDVKVRCHLSATAAPPTIDSANCWPTPIVALRLAAYGLCCQLALTSFSGAQATNTGKLELKVSRVACSERWQQPTIHETINETIATLGEIMRAAHTIKAGMAGSPFQVTFVCRAIRTVVSTSTTATLSYKASSSGLYE